MLNRFCIIFSPTSFDAIVFGCLAPILKAPVTNHVVKNHIKSLHNLMSFINRITTEFFPLSGKGEISVYSISCKFLLFSATAVFNK